MLEEQRQRLFEVYYLCRYERAVALELCARASTVNKAVAIVLLASVFGALAAGTIAFLGTDYLKPIWALINVASVILAIWSAMMSYSEREYEYHELASRFQGLALRIENFGGYATQGDTVDALSIDAKAMAFHREYSEIMDRTRHEYKRFSDQNEKRITTELNARLKQEGKL